MHAEQGTCQVCPASEPLSPRDHAIDIVQPPGIGIPPSADMDAPQMMVTAALAAKSSAETPRKAAGRVDPKPCSVRFPVLQLLHS